jgi:hypothetical protein
MILIVFALVLLNGFFAMSEMSVMTSRKSRLKQMAATSKRAKALELSEKPESFLSTVQIGITVIGVLTGYLGGEALGEVSAEDPGPDAGLLRGQHRHRAGGQPDHLHHADLRRTGAQAPGADPARRPLPAWSRCR